ncbi:MAG TPA: ABC transporter substrate-binding protein [Streptosporangiaceae bacterium]|nr:ABC transporter substrate-binding protein [Streptosporangiaceae bacterium]
MARSHGPAGRPAAPSATPARRPARRRLAAAGAALALCLPASLALAVPAAAAPASSSPSASSSASPAPTHYPKSTFVVGDAADAVDTLNPFVGVTSQDYEVYGLIYDNLMDYGQLDYSPAPRLATSWSHSANGLVWTYHIRQGVKWSDGVPLTAADVAYTFNRDIHGAAERAGSLAYVQNITKVQQTGKYTVVMTVSKPTPGMAKLILPILPEHIWKHVSEKQVTTFSNSHPVGSGPFIVTKFASNQSIALKANPNYWGGKPGISNLVFQYYANPSAEAFALKNGSIAFAEDLPNQLFKSLRGAPGVTLNNAPSGNFDELAFNNGAATVSGRKIGNGNPALLDVNVRHAISYSLDLPKLVSRVLLGYGAPGTSIIPPIYKQFHYSPPPSQQYTYDPAKAKQLLTADGWKTGAGGFRYKNGKELSLRLFIRSQSPTETQAAPYLKSWLNAIGIKVATSFMSDDQLTQVIGDGDYDMFVWGWGVEPNPDFQLSVFTCDQRSIGTPGHITPGWSDSFYCNKSYDQMYSQQKSLDGAARARVVQAMEKQLYVNDPYSLLYYYNDTQAYRSDLFTGYAPQPDTHNGLMLYQEVSWWSYRCLRPAGTSPSLTDHNIGCEHITGLGSTTTAAAASSGPGAGVIGGIVAAVVVLAGAGLLLARRRRVATSDDRE